MAKFEEQLTALETVVEKLERGELSLDESVALFEEGVRLSSACKKDLDAAEGRIQVLTEEGDGEVRDLVLTGDDDDEEIEEGEDLE
jgi:exodeoxyribonuclease VII small subunit